MECTNTTNTTATNADRLQIDCKVAKAAGPATSLDLQAPTTLISFFHLAETLLPGKDSLKRKQASDPEVDTDTSDAKRPRLDINQQPPSPTTLPKLKLKLKNSNPVPIAPKEDGFKLTIKGKKASVTLVSSESHATNVTTIATAVHHAPRNTFRFLDLPGEMRNQVYKELLTHDRANGRRSDPAILRVNKQIHTESRGLLYSERVATIKLEAFVRGPGGVRLEGDIVASDSTYSKPTAIGPAALLTSSKAVSKFADLWPEWLTKIPRINLDLTFEDTGDNVADSWTWYLNDFASMNRALCSLASHLATTTNTTSRIAGRIPTINITIHSTKISDPTFTEAFDNILYPLSKIPDIYTLNLPTDSNITLNHTTAEARSNLLSTWTSSLRPLATQSLNLTPSLCKPSNSGISRTRYPLQPLPGYNVIEAGHLYDLIEYGREIFSTLKYAFEDQACVFTQRTENRLMGMVKVLAETVMALRGFDRYVVQQGLRTETAKDALKRVKRVYEECIGEKSPL